MPFPVGKLLLSTYGEDPQSAVIRSPMESGPPKQAQVLSRVMVTRSVTYRYTSAEYTAFKAWFRDEVSRGAAWWSWTDPVDDTAKQVRMVNGLYTATPRNKTDGAPLEWDVSFELESWEA